MHTVGGGSTARSASPPWPRRGRSPGLLYGERPGERPGEPGAGAVRARGVRRCRPPASEAASSSSGAAGSRPTVQTRSLSEAAIGQPGPGLAAIHGAVDASPLEVADVDGAAVGVDDEARHVGVGQAPAAARPCAAEIGRAVEPVVRGREDQARLTGQDRDGVDAGRPSAPRGSARSCRRRRSSRSPRRVASNTSSRIVATRGQRAAPGPSNLGQGSAASCGRRLGCETRPSGVAARSTPVRKGGHVRDPRVRLPVRRERSGRRLQHRVRATQREEPLVGAGQHGTASAVASERISRPSSPAPSRVQGPRGPAPPGRRRAGGRPTPTPARAGRAGSKTMRDTKRSEKPRLAEVHVRPRSAAAQDSRPLGADAAGCRREARPARSPRGCGRWPVRQLAGVVLGDPEPLGGARVEGVGVQPGPGRRPACAGCSGGSRAPASSAPPPSVDAVDARAGGREDALRVAAVEGEGEDVRVVDHAAVDAASRCAPPSDVFHGRCQVPT